MCPLHSSSTLCFCLTSFFKGLKDLNGLREVKEVREVKGERERLSIFNFQFSIFNSKRCLLKIGVGVWKIKTKCVLLH